MALSHNSTHPGDGTSYFQLRLTNPNNASLKALAEKRQTSLETDQRNDNAMVDTRGRLETATMKWHVWHKVAGATRIACYDYLAHDVAPTHLYTRKQYRTVAAAMVDRDRIDSRTHELDGELRLYAVAAERRYPLIAGFATI